MAENGGPGSRGRGSERDQPSYRRYQASISAVLDPEIFVVGGGVSSAGDLLLDPARQAYAKTLVARGYRDIAPFVVASTGDHAGMIGAADLARQA